MENAVNETVIFDQLKNKGEKFGRDFWWARELAGALNYNWLEFETLINRALRDCRSNSVETSNHCVEVSKTTSGADGKVGHLRDMAMSKYFTHRVVENISSEKSEQKLVQFAQAYFGSKEPLQAEEIDERARTRFAEKKQLTLREAVINYNKWLSSNAKGVGVHTNKEYIEFNQAGIMGLYGGMKPVDIKEAMDLSANSVIYDYMGVKELDANKNRILIAGNKLGGMRRFSGARAANEEHKSAGQEVRDKIEWAGETVPENLKMAKKSVQQIRSEFKKAEKELQGL